MTCVSYCDGMKFYGERLIKMGFAPYENGVPCLFLGLYFPEDYEKLMNHCGRRYIFWNGSDVLRVAQKPGWHNNLRSSTITHACHNEQLRGELETMKIKATIEPTLFGDVNSYPVSYVPGPPWRVYMNCRVGREAEYGLPEAVRMFAGLTDYELHVYGNCEKEWGANIIYHGEVPEEQMDDETASMQGCLRLNKHDGLSQIVIKSILRGQYPVLNEQMLKDLAGKTGPNTETIPNLNVWIHKLAGN
jgi:hypothetical protein